MSRISIHHPHRRPCSGAKIFRRCRNNEDANSVPYIDVDPDFVDNVIILDFPESSPRKKQCGSLPKKDKKDSYGNVIYIDDDDVPENNHSTGLNDVNFSAATSLNGHGSKNTADKTPVRLSKGKRTYSGTFCRLRNRYGLDSDSESNSSDHDVDRDNDLVVDVSGEVQEQWLKAFSRRRTNIHRNRDDEDRHKNVSRKNKDPFFGSSTEKFCDQKDAPSTSKSKGNNSSHHTPLSDDHNVHDLETDCNYTNSYAPETSNSHAPDSPKIFPEKVDPPDHEPESSSCHNKERENHHDLSHSASQKQSTNEFDHLSRGSRDEDTSKLDDAYCNEKSGSLEDDAPMYKRNSSFQNEFMPSTSFQTSPSEDDAPSYERNNSFQTELMPNTSFQTSPSEDDAPSYKRNSSFQTDFIPSSSFQTSPSEDDAPTSKTNNSFQAEFRPSTSFQTTPSEDDAVSYKRNSSFQTDFIPSSSFQTSPSEDDAPTSKTNNSFQAEFRPSTSFSGEIQDHLQSRQSHASGIDKDIGNLTPDKQNDHCATPSSSAAGPFFGKPFISKYCWGSRDGILKATPQENSGENVSLNEPKHREDTSSHNILQEEDKDDQLHSQNGETLSAAEKDKDSQHNCENAETLPSVEKDKDGQQNSENAETLPSEETCIINEREKLKETDDYKRAIEEEWASRQQALLAQAEEAQRLRRLRKRRKAENMRLLDMERRQKQRIEEMRNAQKKDEENMNLKEKIRTELKMELKKLEIVCPNMAYLLHMLGIRVDGWPTPLPREVQAAYKRALLTFHPDRASKSDIRQQVEAEEKFKLINRLKEKFSPSM